MVEIGEKDVLYLPDRLNQSGSRLELSLEGRNFTKGSFTLRVSFLFCNIKINLLETL